MDRSIKNNQSTIAYIQQTARRFLNRETSGGLLLIAATILALILGNSQWADAYHHYLKDEFLFELSEHFTFGLTIEEWINDGLMAIFFLVAGLELKREIMVGELSSFKKASMPLLAALGGMAMPAIIFTMLNSGTVNINGWGIPMATDIAYSLGIIGLLGRRVPAQLKIFLVALAIADDLGAILVIALFYSNQLSWLYLGTGAGIFILLMLFNRLGIKNLFWYLLGGVGLWYCFLNSGVHPTIAGVLFAITIPVKPKLDSKLLKDRTARNVERLEETDIETRDPLQDVRQGKILKDIKKDTENAKPPLLKLENALIDFNAFFIIPIFAIANAGVKLDVSFLEVVSGSLGLGILLGLAVGKVLGISLFAFIGEKLGIAELHISLRWGHIIGMGMIAGIGFTMSLFITNLAFSDPELVKVSKISILIASLIGALGGIITLLFTKPKNENL
ncbi:MULTISPECIES: Na+/H+ antiporter NhaA [Echinicola]|uniref:Na(+)/H(+) antiporter NhaA n=3 Tax=Echinicola TaxID=390846 RepID=L0G6L9_ECHVK|nr:MULTISPECIES: Na+/H+ antiporter NhaA [Echinicola]AGA80641.1 Na+/H+ antiporter NhaA [Echinicola vietnamensis DSM 17526]AWW29460.1 Na+/H+ antiporter NhaA [Echinicola strongylocentroti]GGF42396.1 Na(+)/H(+) antiporter NhaA [Echinicola rosea]